jgi:hypothetical protein
MKMILILTTVFTVLLTFAFIIYKINKSRSAYMNKPFFRCLDLLSKIPATKEAAFEINLCYQKQNFKFQIPKNVTKDLIANTYIQIYGIPNSPELENIEQVIMGLKKIFSDMSEESEYQKNIRENAERREYERLAKIYGHKYKPRYTQNHTEINAAQVTQGDNMEVKKYQNHLIQKQDGDDRTVLNFSHKQYSRFNRYPRFNPKNQCDINGQFINPNLQNNSIPNKPPLITAQIFNGDNAR